MREKHQNDKRPNSYNRRLVVFAGDEINIILNAHDVYDAVKAYFADMPKEGSACAGIAIFKSHMPYSDAYRIAEECCESGKQLMKKYEMKEVNYIDFHYCQGAIGTDLESIREREVGEIISKPWMIRYDPDQVFTKMDNKIDIKQIITLDMIDQLVNNLSTCARTNIKGLLDCARHSESELMTELTRMQLRRKTDSDAGDIADIKGCDGETISSDTLRKMVYDIVSVYDLWFRK